MYQNPTLFAEISNRETWLQTISLNDDDTGDPITLTDTQGNPLYAIVLELALSSSHRQCVPTGFYYDDYCEPAISASLADYITIVDTGVIQIKIPKSIIGALRAQTYDVFLTITDTANDDGRQLLIGKLPVFYGGRNT